MTPFTRRLLAWYRLHGRHDLPWQRRRDPYWIWISEIMLQQTQVATVIPYFERFINRFPDVHALAVADNDEVLHHWSGLGYYARARNMHKAAITVSRELDGRFPAELEELMALPGIGRSTAGAILSLSGQGAAPILDGNVKRVLARYHGIDGWPGEREVGDRLWQAAAEHTPARDAAAYTQAIMDLGATLCTRVRPRCGDCPVAAACHARIHGLQSALPARRERRVLPVRQTIFTIIQNPCGEVLLQKRPPAGIWGGLWGFPECPPGEEVAAWISRRYGVHVAGLEAQRGLRHSFTHFHLDILPYRAKLAAGGDAVREAQCRWYSPGCQTRVGLAAPVKKLLEAL